MCIEVFVTPKGFNVLLYMTGNLEEARAKLRRYQEAYYNLEPDFIRTRSGPRSTISGVGRRLYFCE